MDDYFADNCAKSPTAFLLVQDLVFVGSNNQFIWFICLHPVINHTANTKQLKMGDSVSAHL